MKKADANKYFLAVSDDGCVLECWAKDYSNLIGLVQIYDDEDNPHKVSIIIDVLDRRIHEHRMVD